MWITWPLTRRLDGPGNGIPRSVAIAAVLPRDATGRAISLGGTRIPVVLPRLAPGITVHAPLVPARDTVEAIAGELLAQLPERFALCGFSFGGYVQARAAEKLRPQHLVLVAPADRPASGSCVSTAHRAIDSAIARSCASASATRASRSVVASVLSSAIVSRSL